MKHLVLPYAILAVLTACTVNTSQTPAITAIDNNLPSAERSTDPIPSSDTVVLHRDEAAQIGIVTWIDEMSGAGKTITYADPVDQLAAEFVQFALAFGQIDADYVDAYHGPTAWKTIAETQTETPEELVSWIAGLRGSLELLQPTDAEEAVRIAQLKKLSRAAATRLELFAGRRVSFNREVTDIYDERPLSYDLSAYDPILVKIDALLSGEGSIAERVDAFRTSLAIPKDKLKPVFDRAIAECRARTARYFDLPEGESFRMDFVTDKTWSGYNYYQGGYESLIQINTDFPIIIDRAVDLGCHEGYPGHHVWNLFIERELVGNRGWIEYTVNPLFGPFGPIAEGSANYGIRLAFPGQEKITFEKEVLFPLAGLDPALADKLDRLNALTGQLSHATNEIARQYLAGNLTREEAIPLIQKYYLASYDKSEQRLRFIEKYRAYVINYNVGLDRAASWVEAAGEDPSYRWAAFKEMLTRPLSPGDIAAQLDEISGSQ